MSFELAQAQYDAAEPPDSSWICKFCDTENHDHFWMEKTIEECECCGEYMAEAALGRDVDDQIKEMKEERGRNG